VRSAQARSNRSSCRPSRSGLHGRSGRSVPWPRPRCSRTRRVQCGPRVGGSQGRTYDGVALDRVPRRGEVPVAADRTRPLRAALGAARCLSHSFRFSSIISASMSAVDGRAQRPLMISMCQRACAKKNANATDARLLAFPSCDCPRMEAHAHGGRTQGARGFGHCCLPHDVQMRACGA
jgi:hypothetical protein